MRPWAIVAAAILIDRSGVRGLAQRFASARREGHSVVDVVREALADSWVPEWVPERVLAPKTGSCTRARKAGSGAGESLSGRPGETHASSWTGA